MRYLKVQWLQSSPEYPHLIFSEMDSEGWEQRKVEYFSDGRIGYASASEETPETGTGLGLVPVPSTAEIAADPEFVPEEISRESFEQVWNRRREQHLAQ